MEPLSPKDICAFLNGYKFCTNTEHLITGKIQSIDLDALKKTVVECMKDYIENTSFSNEALIPQLSA